MDIKKVEKILKEWVSQPTPELNSLIIISFKAGQRDVAEWVEENITIPYPVGSVGYISWQNKLKEWNV